MEGDDHVGIELVEFVIAHGDCYEIEVVDHPGSEGRIREDDVFGLVAGPGCDELPDDSGF